MYVPDHHHRRRLTVNIDVRSRQPLVIYGLGAGGDFYLAAISAVTRRRGFVSLVQVSVKSLEEAGGRDCG
jgi:ATP-dependent protease HslVU (ClpYQ) peptidase subunit